LGGQEVRVEWKKLGEIATFTYGYTAKAEECGEVRYIRITDINDGGCLIPDNGKYISYTQDTEPYLLKKGDLVMARTGATYGKTLYYNEDYLSAYASFLIKINLQDLVNPRFYWHFSKSNLYWEQARKLVGGGAQPQFNTGAISQIVIPIPPLTEQQRIVEVLDRFDTLTNDITAGLPAEIEARRKQYEYYRDQLLTFKQKA
jgi:type I restriction enzyme S subunit